MKYALRRPWMNSDMKGSGAAEEVGLVVSGDGFVACSLLLERYGDALYSIRECRCRLDMLPDVLQKWSNIAGEGVTTG